MLFPKNQLLSAQSPPESGFPLGFFRFVRESRLSQHQVAILLNLPKIQSGTWLLDKDV